MAEIDTQMVVDAVTLALRSMYPSATILDEKAAQGIQAGDFIVRLVTTQQQSLMGPRYRRRPLLEVVYFSLDSTACITIGDKLGLLLQTVKTPKGDFLHGTGMDWRIEEGVLYFTVAYHHNIWLAEEKTEMGALEIKEKQHDKSRKTTGAGL